MVITAALMVGLLVFFLAALLVDRGEMAQAAGRR